MNKKKTTRKIVIEIEADLYRKLRIACAESDFTISRVVRDAIKRFIE